MLPTGEPLFLRTPLSTPDGESARTEGELGEGVEGVSGTGCAEACALTSTPSLLYIVVKTSSHHH